jgi:cytidine deaminase
MSITTPQLYQAACEVRTHAYAPYSSYQVGAALSVKGSSHIFIGCNVENASYGGTICAERAAVLAAVAAVGPEILIDRLVLVTETPATPCGMCLQVLSEFSDSETRLFTATPSALGSSYPLSRFLPQPFDSKNLGNFHD